ncbi:PREDICTED: SET and MYND domain-containing protein 4-like [Cyphomyrmex costatus]|uniref:SET and MYND domain-containing protein 4 n=1 Tax=Cyphomyrmex costatus TaxID=456900 RepID=A0A195CR60_9HYME|nr:PREDICTED: SET and MYND domain-containing protein 4-like [Cyphomyrmex costatus]KYN03191.1 SET and MYND domain-containing protein 4 [Cyphomyrmex costatus]
MLGNEPEPEIGGFFRSNLLAVRKAIYQQDFKKFSALKSDAERVAFVLSYSEAYKLPLEVEKPTAKDRDSAIRLKDIGNKFFGRGEFTKALETYSNAALLAPSTELSIILANRSATLYHLERHEYALEDIEEASLLGYSKDLLYKLEERRARCLLGLKRHDEAVEAFRRALQALDDARIPLERRQKFEADIRMMLVVMDKGKRLNEAATKNLLRVHSKQKSNARLEDRLIPKRDRNPVYPACSRAVEIKDDKGDIGRHAVATRKITPGEIVIVERPHCAFLLAETRLAHCHLCFMRIFVPTPAACCNCVAYCSRRCRDADAPVHSKECKLLPALWYSKASVTCFLALRAITQRPFEEVIMLQEQFKNPGNALKFSAVHPYRGDDYMGAFYNLVTHEDKRLPEDIFHRAYMTTWLFRLLRSSNYLPENVKTTDSANSKLSDEELFIAGLLLHNLQSLQFNTHEISELVRPKGQKTLAKAKSVFIGGGVYPTVAMLNHSCNPGVVRYFIGTTMIVRAIRTINVGEEISENYGPIFTTTPESERKRKLRMQYWFDCNCEACSGHWPLLDELDPTVLRFKCETGPSCGNVLLVKSDTNEFMIGCAKCGKSTNILKGLKALQDTDELFRVASMNLEEGQNEHALKAYLEILKLLDETLVLPIKDYHTCQQGIRLCALALGNTAYI